MPDSEVDPTFAKTVKENLERLKMTPAQFARLVGVHPSFISRFLDSKRYPPDDLEPWGRALNLSGADLEAFLVEGGLTRSPPFIQALVKRLWKRPKG